MTGWQPYDSYRATSDRFIPRMPTGWCLVPLKRALLQNDGGVWGDDPDGGDDTIVLRSTDQTADGHWSGAEPARRRLSEADRQAAYLREGDLLVTKSSGSALHIGKTTLVTSEIAARGCCYSNFMQRLRVSTQIDPKLAWYVLNSEFVRKQLDVLSTSTTGLANLNGTLLGELALPLPSNAEQEQIVKLLDRETARIAALIEKKTRFIELLREKRQALITQAVTRGFDSATPLEASAVEWLPPIPAHWSVTRLRFVIKAFEQGWSPECYAYPAGAGEWGVVKAGCVNRGVFDPEQNKRLPEEHVPREDIEIRPGDVLMSRASGSVELIGSVARATATDARLMLSDKTFRLALQPEWDADFFVYTMQSSAVRDQILAAISGAEGLANNLAQASIKEFIVVQPPRSEQEQVAVETTARLSSLDKIAALTESSLHLLRERRAALITAAVTGQIDVRAEVPEEQSEPA